MEKIKKAVSYEINGFFSLLVGMFILWFVLTAILTGIFFIFYYFKYIVIALVALTLIFYVAEQFRDDTTGGNENV